MMALMTRGPEVDLKWCFSLKMRPSVLKLLSSCLMRSMSSTISASCSMTKALRHVEDSIDLVICALFATACHTPAQFVASQNATVGSHHFKLIKPVTLIPAVQHCIMCNLTF